MALVGDTHGPQPSHLSHDEAEMTQLALGLSRCFRLCAQHAAEYRALMLEAYAVHPEAFTTSAGERQELPLSWWEARLGAQEDATEVVFGAFHQGVLAGVVGLSFMAREKARHKATLFGMVVAQPYRRLGLGQQLVSTALDYAQGRPGVKLVQLTVTQGNAAAQRLYERNGFGVFGLEPYAVAVGSAYVTKVHMWRRLDSLPI